MGTTLERLIDGVERRSTWKNAAVAVGVTLLANFALAGYILPSIEARRPEAMDGGFLVMIDLQPLVSAAEAYRIFDLYKPDILGFVRLLYAVDFVIPVAFACFFACMIGKMLRYLGTKGGWRAALLLPFAAVPFDYTENVLSLVLISLYQGGQVFPALAGVAGLATAGKFLSLGLTGLVVVVLLLRSAAKFVAAKLGGPRGA